MGPTGGGEGGGRREEEKPPPSGGGGISGGEGGVGQDSKYLQDQERLRRLWVLISQLLCACVHACMCACVHVYVQNRIFWWPFLSPSLFAAFSPLLARNLPLHDMPAELTPKPLVRGSWRKSWSLSESLTVILYGHNSILCRGGRTWQPRPPSRAPSARQRPRPPRSPPVCVGHFSVLSH